MCVTENYNLYFLECGQIKYLMGEGRAKMGEFLFWYICYARPLIASYQIITVYILDGLELRNTIKPLYEGTMTQLSVYSKQFTNHTDLTLGFSFRTDKRCSETPPYCSTWMGWLLHNTISAIHVHFACYYVIR